MKLWRVILGAILGALALFAAGLAARQRAKAHEATGRAEIAKVNNELAAFRHHQAVETHAKRKAKAHEERAKGLIAKAGKQDDTGKIDDLLSRWRAK